MEKKLKLNLKNMKVLQYESGNMKKYYLNPGDTRPVCALLLCDQNDMYKVKVLFKHENAVHVSRYINNRRTLALSIDESANIIGTVREFRDDCVVIDEVEHIHFDVKFGLTPC
jgi:hypothetical protein